MRKKRGNRKVIVIIAGPNGAGKTTFAEQLLVDEEGSPEFINADMIARALSPGNPEEVSLAAGKVMLREIHGKVDRGENFAFETTLSGLNYSRHIPKWRRKGYHVRLVFLALPSADTAVSRVQIRVGQGGHNVPESVVRRRFALGIKNFEEVYRGLVNSWAVYDCSEDSPVMKDRMP
jgi:predicted ABC-type ATPase